MSNPSSPKTRFAPKDPEDPAESVAKKRASFSSNSRPPSPRTSSCFQQEAESIADRRNSEKYVLFRTRSSKIEKQLSRLREQQEQQDSQEIETSSPVDDRQVPAGRYFDALHGPEFEQLKESEDALLPLDQKWPFLLRFPISAFGVALGLGSQSILWKNLATMPAVSFLRAPDWINTMLWFVATFALVTIFITYCFKALFYFEAVRREYYHPVRANFFFAPWIAAMFLALGLPPSTGLELHPWIWWVLMSPILVLELKIYGQWLSGGERRLSKIANPSTHLSVVGNFVGALLGATCGWKESSIFFWAIGLAHYLVLFVTLYQRLPTNEALPKELHPVFFLFIAAPSAASLAWEKISGDFNVVSKLVYFIALFLFCSLVVRINFFRGFRFSFAWWAYTFPMTAISIASTHYSQEVPTGVSRALAAGLSLASSLVVLLLFVSTMCHLIFWKTLFPNDLAIAVTRRKQKTKKKQHKIIPKNGENSDDHESGESPPASGSLGSPEDDSGDARRIHESRIELSCFGNLERG